MVEQNREIFINLLETPKVRVGFSSIGDSVWITYNPAATVPSESETLPRPLVRDDLDIFRPEAKVEAKGPYDEIEKVTIWCNRLWKALCDGFDEEELHTLCFIRLKMTYEDLKGEGLSNKARELVDYMKRRRSLDILEAAIRQERPRFLWK